LQATRRERRNRRITAAFMIRGFARIAEAFGMNGLIYLIGLIVVIMAILSFFGLR
jgi:hypothetical protein